MSVVKCQEMVEVEKMVIIALTYFILASTAAAAALLSFSFSSDEIELHNRNNGFTTLNSNTGSQHLKLNSSLASLLPSISNTEKMVGQK